MHFITATNKEVGNAWKSCFLNWTMTTKIGYFCPSSDDVYIYMCVFFMTIAKKNVFA